MSGADGQRRDRSLHRVPRAAQHRARPGEGRHPIPPRRDARRGDRAGGVDDLEVRRREHPVRRRQGWNRLRPYPDIARELEALTRRYVWEIIDLIGHDKNVPAPDVNTNDQVMAWVMDTYSMHVGHTFTAVVTGKPLELEGIAGSARGDRPGRHDRDPRGRPAPETRHPGRNGRRSGLRQRRVGRGRAARRRRRRHCCGNRRERGRLRPERPRRRQYPRILGNSIRRSTASLEAHRSATKSCLPWTSMSSYPPRSRTRPTWTMRRPSARES